ncbi:MAG: HIT family protein [Candidatus Woesearchaeota archaeon]
MPEKEYTEEDLKNMSEAEIAELQKQNCIFCKIASKEIPAKIIHEDSDTICILDINPASEGHILVYPKKHYMILPHMPDAAIAKVFANVRLMSHTLLKTLQCRGTTVFIANGVAAGQKAPHALIHVFPRRENDGLVKLPQYEMNSDQKEKLKKILKPYMNQLFDIREENISNDKSDDIPELDEMDYEKKEKTIIKDAEFSEKKPEKKKEERMIRKTDKNDTTDKKNSKVDLNDIARLFGG